MITTNGLEICTFRTENARPAVTLKRQVPIIDNGDNSARRVSLLPYSAKTPTPPPPPPPNSFFPDFERSLFIPCKTMECWSIVNVEYGVCLLLLPTRMQFPIYIETNPEKAA